MRSEKNDLRVRNTKKRLRQTYAQLMSEKPLQNITVAELCKRAEINRSTFYAHYTDIYDLQQKLELEIYSEFQEALSDIDITKNFTTEGVPIFMITIFSFLKRNADMCAVFLGPHSDRKFVMNLLDIAKETTIIQYGQIYKKASVPQLEMYFTFMASGCIGLLEYWIRSGLKEPAEEMARITNLMITRGMAYLEAPGV